MSATPSTRCERANWGGTMTDTTEPTLCARCHGCGQIADDADGAPWSVWMNVPLRASMAGLSGNVRPVACPACDGAGTVRRQQRGSMSTVTGGGHGT